MIGKTVRTLRDNPVILLGFAIPFLYILVNYLFFGGAAIGNIGIIGGNNIVSKVWFEAGRTIIVLLAWFLLVFPSILYRTYEAVDDKKQAGWFKRGLGQWWRMVVIIGLTLAISVVVLVPLVSLLYFLIASIKSELIIYISAGIIIAVLLTLLVYQSVGMAAVYAEKRVGTGINNIVKVARRRFVAIMLTGVMMFVPLILRTALGLYGIEIGERVTIIAICIAGIFLSSYMSTYCMHWYVRDKNMMELRPLKGGKHTKE